MSLSERVDHIKLVDHHCHSISDADMARVQLEGFLTEGPGLGEGHGRATLSSTFDTPLGTSLRRWCAPVLDLPPFADAESYLQRRVALGAEEVNRRFLRAAGVSDFMVDGGYREAELIDEQAFSELSGARVHRVIRLESLAEEIAGSCRPDQFPDRFTSVLHERASGAVALKSIVAYRYGLDLAPQAPSRSEVVDAVGEWSRAARRSGRWRLVEPVLLRHVLWSAATLGHRLQLHVGLGDSDVRLHRANPALLTEFIRAIESTGTTVLLLHCWPYQRQAAHLAAVYPHVFFDVGLALNHVGPRAKAVVAEAMEIAPYQKLLYSSDGFGISELHYLGALRFRRATAAVLDEWVTEGEMDLDYAVWVAEKVGVGNACRVYKLHEPPG